MAADSNSIAKWRNYGHLESEFEFYVLCLYDD